jgi:hypothetical protein
VNLLYVCADCQYREMRQGERSELSTCPSCKKDHFAPATRFIVGATWDDVPHLTRAAKNDLWGRMPPHQRDARSKGIPALGSGSIYPIAESDIKVKPFEIPKHWPRGYGLDVGWNRTAAVWLAHDRESGVRYLYSEHYRGEAEPTVHSSAIRGRGTWIPGWIDPAAHGRSQVDGEKLITTYRQSIYGEDLGEQMLKNADHAVEAGLYAVWELLTAGRLKVFSSLSNWFEEFRIYHRDEKGQIVKKRDHLMDATRYLILAGVELLAVEPPKKDPDDPEDKEFGFRHGRMTAWME